MSQESSQKLVSLFEGIGKELSMKELEDRLEVQKIPYLAQEFGIDLGYTFKWYLKGPYSKQVTSDGFLIYESLKNDQQIPHDESLDEQKLREFREIITPFMNDSIWLEIAGSLLFLKKENYPERSYDEVIGFLIEDLTCGYKNFDEDLVRKVISDLRNNQLIK